MYARLLTFALGPGKRADAEAFAEDIAPLIASQQGCKSVQVFGDDADGRYEIYVLWETEADANAAAWLVRPKVDQHLAGKLQGPIDARLYEVISSNP